MGKYDIGKQRIKDILGDKAENILKIFEEISSEFSHYVVDFAYGDLYARKGLTDKTREIAAVACLIGQGNTGIPLKAHLTGMLNVGWEKTKSLDY